MFSLKVSSLPLIPLLILMWIAHFFVDVMLGIWPLYKTMAQIDLSKAGLIVACGAFIGEGSQLIFGTLSDKGFRQILITFGLLISIGNLFLPYFSSEGVYFFLFLLTCIGSGCFHPCAASLINSVVPSKRNFLMTLFASGGSCGLAASQILFSYTYESFNGQTWPLLIPVCLIVIVLVFVRLPQPTVINIESKQEPKWKDFIYFFKTPLLRNLYISQVANQSIFWGTIFILPDILKDWGHSSWICCGGGHAFLILGGALAMIPAGYLADKFSAITVLYIASLISCFLFYLILLLGGSSSAFLITALFLLGACLALMNPIAVAYGVSLEPNRSGTISAFLMGLVWCVSESAGPGSLGIMTQLFTELAPLKSLAILGSLFIIQIYTTFLLSIHAKTIPTCDAA